MKKERGMKTLALFFAGCAGLWAQGLPVTADRLLDRRLDDAIAATA